MILRSGNFKSPAATNYATRAGVCEAHWLCEPDAPSMESWGGIEPPYKAFAELRLTTWPPGRWVYASTKRLWAKRALEQIYFLS